MDKPSIRCSTFRCYIHGDRRCCQGCGEPCEHRCLNSPDRCGLVFAGESVHQAQRPAAEPWNKSGHRYRSFDPAAAYRLWLKGLTQAEIAERLGVNATTIWALAKKMRGWLPKGGRRMKMCLCDVCGKQIELPPVGSVEDTSILDIRLDLCPECREWAMHIPRDMQINLALEGIRRRRRADQGEPPDPLNVAAASTPIERMHWKHIGDTSPDRGEVVLCIGKIDGTWRGRFGVYTHDRCWMIETPPGTWCYLPSSRLPYWLPIGFPSALRGEEADRSSGAGTGGDGR